MTAARKLQAVPALERDSKPENVLLEELRDTAVGRAYGIERAEYTSARSIRIKLGRGKR